MRRLIDSRYIVTGAWVSGAVLSLHFARRLSSKVLVLYLVCIDDVSRVSRETRVTSINPPPSNIVSGTTSDCTVVEH